MFIETSEVLRLKIVANAIAMQCDGAASRDDKGFNGADAPFIQNFISQDESKVSAKFFNSVHKSLAKYKKQMDKLGVYDLYKDVKKVDEKLYKPMELENLNFEEILELKDGDVMPKNAWHVYRQRKQDLKDLGFTTYPNHMNQYIIKKVEIKNTINWSEVDNSTYVKHRKKLKYPYYLFEWQRPKVIERLNSILNYGGTLDNSCTGAGKTYMALSVAKELELTPIVMTLKSVVSSFNEVMKDHFKMEGYVSNYESFKLGKTPFCVREEKEIIYRGKPKKEYSFEWNLPKKSILIIDEVHKCSNYKTQNFKMLQSAIDQGDIIIYAMSATVADNPMRMGVMGRVLNLFESSNGFFRWAIGKGARKGRFGWECLDTKNNMQKIKEEIIPYRAGGFSRNDLREHFKETRIIARCIDLDDSQVKVFNRTFKRLLSESKRDDLEIVINQRQRQALEMAMIPQFEEMALSAIEEGESVCVFLNFDESIIELAQRLKTKNIIWGKNKDGEREMIRKKFQDDKINLVILNIQAGGVGISLHDLNGVRPRRSLISPTWSAVNLVQSLGRIDRAGSKSASIQEIIFARDTFLENVYDKVKTKIENIQALTDDDLTWEEN